MADNKSAGVRSAPPELQLGEAPGSSDPQAQAQYFIQMLDAFAQQGTPEAKRIRTGLIEAVTEYGEAEDKQAARAVLKARLTGLEVGVSELLLRATRKLRDRFVQESRKLGTATKPGQTARAAADGFTMMVEALDKMLQSAQSGDAAMRDEAHALLAQAREKMEALQQPG